MDKLNENLSWYQAKIGNYDKQYWELSAEQRILQGLERRPKMKAGTSVLQPELIDVDLIRGSAYSKAKPLHNGRVIVWNGFLRVVFAPVYYRFWCQHTSDYFALLFMLHYCLCILHIVVNFCFSSKQTFWDEHFMPLLCTLFLGIIHAHIVSPVMQKKKKTPKQEIPLDNVNKILEDGGQFLSKLSGNPEMPTSIIATSKKKRRRVQNPNITIGSPSGNEPTSDDILTTGASVLTGGTETVISDTGLETETPSEYTGSLLGAPETPSIVKPVSLGGDEVQQLPFINVIAATPVSLSTNASCHEGAATNAGATELISSVVKECDPAQLQAFIHAKNKQIPDPVTYPDVPQPNHCHHPSHHQAPPLQQHRTSSLSAEPGSFCQRPPANTEETEQTIGDEQEQQLYDASSPPTSLGRTHHTAASLYSVRERELSPFSQAQLAHLRLRHTSFGNVSTSVHHSKGTRHASLSIDPEVYALSMANVAKMNSKHSHHSHQMLSRSDLGKDSKRNRSCAPVQYIPQYEQIDSCSSSPAHGENPDDEASRNNSEIKIESSHPNEDPIPSTGISSQTNSSPSIRHEQDHSNQHVPHTHTQNMVEKDNMESTASQRDAIYAASVKRHHYRRHGRYNSFAARENDDTNLFENADDVFQVASEDLIQLHENRPSDLFLPLQFDGELQYPLEAERQDKLSRTKQKVIVPLPNDRSAKSGNISAEDIKLTLPQNDNDVDEDEDNLLSPRSHDSGSEHSDSHGNSADNSAAELSDSDLKPLRTDYALSTESVDSKVKSTLLEEDEEEDVVQFNCVTRPIENHVPLIVNGLDRFPQNLECKDNGFETDVKKEITSHDIEYGTHSMESYSPTVLIEDSTMAKPEYSPDYYSTIPEEDRDLPSAIHQGDFSSLDGKHSSYSHQSVTVTSPNNAKNFKLLRALEVTNVPDSPVMLHTCHKEMQDVEQAFLRDMPELNAISNEDTITTNRRQKSKFETLFRIRSEVTRRCAAPGESILCHKHHTGHSSQGDTEDDMDIGNRNNSIREAEPFKEKLENFASNDDYGSVGGGAGSRKGGNKGYASSAGGSSSGMPKSLTPGVTANVTTNNTLSADVTAPNKKNTLGVAPTGTKKKTSSNKSRSLRGSSHELCEDNSGATLKPSKSMLHKNVNESTLPHVHPSCCISYSTGNSDIASQVSETEYDRINSDVASEDSTSIEDDAATEPPPTLQDPEDPFVLWYKETHQGGAMPKAHPSLTEAVGCFFWENGTLKKADLTLLDIGWSIIQSVEKQPEDSTYMNLAIWFPLLLACLPVFHRFYTNTHYIVQLYTLFLHLQLVFFQRPSALYDQLKYQYWNSMGILVLGVALRLFCYFLAGVLLFIAEKTFQQRLQYAKHFCYLTSSRLARKYHLPHFRLNKVRNIKFWLSLRSYLKKRGPQRSVESIITYVFYLFFFLISIVCFRILTTDANLLNSLLYWEIGGIMIFLSIFIVRFITMSTKITKKYRNLSVLMTEQINLYLTIDKKPHKRDELLLANNTLKLAEDLLKEVDGPFRVCGWSINPLVYNILKVVILSACSAVLSDYCGFKLKLYKIKLNPINW